MDGTIVNDTTYQEPVSALLTYGSCLEIDKKVKNLENERIIEQIIESGDISKIDRSLMAQLKPSYRFEKWPNYLEELGITAEHVPELIRMTTDEDLNYADGESLEVWAPVHAWRCLGLLKAPEAVGPLLRMLDDDEFADWMMEEIPWVLGMIGEDAIAPTSLYLASRKYADWSRTAAVSALEYIATLHPALKETCIKKLGSQLADFRNNGESLNGFIVSSLIELEAVSKANVIERAYAAGEVDESICGNWPNVQIDLGLATKADFDPSELEPNFAWVRDDRRPDFSNLPSFEPPMKAVKKKTSEAVGFGGSKKKKSKKKKK